MTARNVVPASRIIPHPTNVVTARLSRSPNEGESPWTIMIISTTANRIKNAAEVRNMRPPITEKMAWVVD
jgi:hypothetical protein